jgi:hypothetical protein
MRMRPAGHATALALGAGLALTLLSACGRNEAETDAPAPAAPEAAADAAPAPGAEAPRRRPGLWEQRVSSEGMVQVSRICLDEALEARFSWWGQPATQEVCEKNLVSPRADGGWQFSSVCDMGAGGRTTTSGVVTGDFQSRYVVEAETSTVGASAPQMNGTRQMRIEGVWQGACPEGFRPGDMELPGGIRINMLDLAPGG